MTPAKSFKKLRSASAAFLEDGGTLLHQIDDLLRDVQRCWQGLEGREQQLADREALFQQKESRFLQLLESFSLLAQGEQRKLDQPMAKQVTESPTRASLDAGSDETAVTLDLEREVFQLRSAITGELEAAAKSALARPVDHASAAIPSESAASSPAHPSLPNPPGMIESATSPVVSPLPSMVRPPRSRRRPRRR